MCKSIRSLSITVIAIVFLAGSLFAQDAGKNANNGGLSMDEKKMQEMFALWQKYASPSKPHESFKKLEGDWKAEMKMFMGPDAPPQQSSSVCSYESVMEGRFLQFHYTGKMMDMPYEGIGYLGYDNFKQKYNLFWIDNMTTAIIIAYGEASADGKTITLMGKMDEPTTGEKDKDVKYVYKFIDDNHHTFEIWDLLPGNEFIALEIDYSR
ncbi:MAG: DUF1579 domain-containing protein [bacterium]|nr:DUF1579 domain-containing protein [bacterium]